MRPANNKIKINPKLIEWAVVTSGLDTAQLAKKLKIHEETLLKWIKGKDFPTFKELEALASYTKRPLAAFFLPSPPKEKSLPKDYRVIYKKPGKFSPTTLWTIREARRLQEIGKILLENLGLTTKPNIEFVTLNTNAEEIALEYRNLFQINEELQKKWRNAYEAFNYFKKEIEKLNIFVFQFSMPIEDARGFTLTDEEPFVIVINSKESIEARLFTLLHEFAHALLNDLQIDLPENSLLSSKVTNEVNDVNRIEKWCNEFASELLFPRSIAKRVFKENIETILKDDTLKRLSKTYKISKTMLLYKALKLGYIGRKEYEEKTKNIKSYKGGGFQTAHKKCINEKGEKFIQLVDSNLENGNISFTDALDYLRVKAEHYEKIIQSIKG